VSERLGRSKVYAHVLPDMQAGSGVNAQRDPARLLILPPDGRVRLDARFSNSPLTSATPEGKSTAAQEEKHQEDDEERVGIHGRYSREARRIPQDAPALVYGLLVDVLCARLTRKCQSLDEWQRPSHARPVDRVQHMKCPINRAAKNHVTKWWCQHSGEYGRPRHNRAVRYCTGDADSSQNLPNP
jgi:hypothetical protein